MRRLSPLTLALVATVTAALTYVLVERFYATLPPVGWSSVTLYLLAAVDAGLAWWIRGAVSQRRIGQDRSQVHPLTVVRVLAVGQASAVLGSLGAGCGAGLVAFSALRRSTLVAAADDLWPSVAVLVGGVALTAAGLWVERECRIPPRDDDGDGLASPASPA